MSDRCAWEMTIKKALGKLSAPSDLEDQLRSGGFVELAVTVADGLAAGALPSHHDDPFDRVLIAQAHRRGLTIVTRDPSFAAYGARPKPSDMAFSRSNSNARGWTTGAAAA